MAHTEYKPDPISAPGLIKSALTWMWGGLIKMGENSARARVAHQVATMSDAELAARGLTRSDLAKRVLSDGYHL